MVGMSVLGAVSVDKIFAGARVVARDLSIRLAMEVMMLLEGLLV